MNLLGVIRQLMVRDCSGGGSCWWRRLFIWQAAELQLWRESSGEKTPGAAGQNCVCVPDATASIAWAVFRALLQRSCDGSGSM